MTDPAMAYPRGTSPPPNRLRPPAVRSPKLVQGAGFTFFRRTAMRKWIKRHGRIFEINVPLFGRSVIVSDPVLAKSVCTAGAEHLGNVQPNLGNWFGGGSVFGLDGSRHRDRRRLLAPVFHGRSLKNYEHIFSDETLREIANWPENKEFRILEPMNRITLNVILRAMFGVDEPNREELRQLREIIPPYMKLGQLLAFLPTPPFRIGAHDPWAKLRELREAFDRIVARLIAAAEADPGGLDPLLVGNIITTLNFDLPRGEPAPSIAERIRHSVDRFVDDHCDVRINQRFLDAGGAWRGVRCVSTAFEPAQWNPLISNQSGFGVYRLQFEDSFTSYYTVLMNVPVAGLGGLLDGAGGRGLLFQMALPPKEFQAMSSPAMSEQLHRFRHAGDEIPRLHREIHG